MGDFEVYMEKKKAPNIFTSTRSTSRVNAMATEGFLSRVDFVTENLVRM